MIEVIKHGDTYKSHTCVKCNCEFLYQEIDVDRRVLAGDPTKKLRYLLCPECSNWNRLTSD